MVSKLSIYIYIVAPAKKTRTLNEVRLESRDLYIYMFHKRAPSQKYPGWSFGTRVVLIPSHAGICPLALQFHTI